MPGGTSLDAIKFNNSGLWNVYVPLSTGATQIWNQTGLGTSTLTTPGTNFGSMSAVTFADFQRVGHAGLVSIGSDVVSASAPIIQVLSTVDDLVYSKVTLTGNARAFGAVVAYDKTGDGYLDLAFGDSTNSSLSFVTNTAGALTWMNGTATSGNGRPTGSGTANSYAELSAVDLNNNGTVDIVGHTNSNGNFSLTTFMNDQLSLNAFVMNSLAGVFATPSGSTNAIAMTWADFNNDGYMDLYLNKGRSADNTADTNASRIYWNNHNGGFGTVAGTTGGAATYFTDVLNGTGSLALDWNHDGRMDVLEAPAFGVASSVVLYTNLGAGVFSAGTSISNFTPNTYTGISATDLNWDGAIDLFVNVLVLGSNIPVLYSNQPVADGNSIHLSIFDAQGINAFYGNTVQLYNSSGALVSSQIINPQMGLTGNDSSALVYFYGLSASETYTAVLLNSISGVSSDVSGLGVMGGKAIEQINATWAGLTAGLATHNYVLSAEAGSNNANGNFIGTGYNDTFFATAGTDTFTGGAGWQTHYGTPAWSISGGEDIVDFRLAGTAVTVNMNTTTAQGTGFNTVTLTGIEGITGGAGNDNLTASSTSGVNSLLDGRGGNDTYTISGGGHTLLTFTDLNSGNATGGNGSDTAIGFGLGNVNTVTAADVIDLSALLTGYTGTAYVYTDITTSKPVLDKASEGLMNYLSVTNNGTNTSISVDRDGTGSTFAPTLVLTLNNVATDMEILLVNHQLIV
ncbi:hypothetical protein EMIT0P265_350001 [Pseudomonas zeae]